MSEVQAYEFIGKGPGRRVTAMVTLFFMVWSMVLSGFPAVLRPAAGLAAPEPVIAEITPEDTGTVVYVNSDAIRGGGYTPDTTVTVEITDEGGTKAGGQKMTDSTGHYSLTAEELNPGGLDIVWGDSVDFKIGDEDTETIEVPEFWAYMDVEDSSVRGYLDPAAAGSEPALVHATDAADVLKGEDTSTVQGDGSFSTQFEFPFAADDGGAAYYPLGTGKWVGFDLTIPKLSANTSFNMLSATGLPPSQEATATTDGNNFNVETNADGTLNIEVSDIEAGSDISVTVGELQVSMVAADIAATVDRDADRVSGTAPASSPITASLIPMGTEEAVSYTSGSADETGAFDLPFASDVKPGDEVLVTSTNDAGHGTAALAYNPPIVITDTDIDGVYYNRAGNGDILDAGNGDTLDNDTLSFDLYGMPALGEGPLEGYVDYAVRFGYIYEGFNHSNVVNDYQNLQPSAFAGGVASFSTQVGSTSRNWNDMPLAIQVGAIDQWGNFSPFGEIIEGQQDYLPLADRATGAKSATYANINLPWYLSSGEETTDLSTPELNLGAIDNLTLQVWENGTITFNEPVDLLSNIDQFNNISEDNLWVGEGEARIHSENLSFLANKSATVMMAHLTNFKTTPNILAFEDEGPEVPTEGLVSNVAFNDDTGDLTFDVAHFTIYRAVETKRLYVDVTDQYVYGNGFASSADTTVTVRNSGGEVYQTTGSVGDGGSFEYYVYSEDDDALIRGNEVVVEISGEASATISIPKMTVVGNPTTEVVEGLTTPNSQVYIRFGGEEFGPTALSRTASKQNKQPGKPLSMLLLSEPAYHTVWVTSDESGYFRYESPVDIPEYGYFLVATQDANGNWVEMTPEFDEGTTDAYEEDDSMTDAKPIVPNGEIQLHNIGAAGDWDFTVFTAEAGVDYRIETMDLGEDADTYIFVYDSDGDLIDSNDDYGDSGLRSRVDLYSEEGGTYYIKVRDYSDNEDYGPDGSYRLKVSTARGPIAIYGDYDFTAENGVTGGSGAADDPYVIEGWTIDASWMEMGAGIQIYDTSKHFIIRNVLVDSSYGWYTDGIYLSEAPNGKIENSHIVFDEYWGGWSLSAYDYATTGIDLYNSDGVTISDASVQGPSDYGLYAYGSDALTVTNLNTDDDTQFGAYLENSSEAVINGSRLYGDEYGLYLYGSQNASINGGSILGDDEDGLRAYASPNLAVDGTSIEGDEYGVRVNEYNDGLTIRNAYIYADDEIGVQVRQSKNVLIENSTIEAEDGQGLKANKADGLKVVGSTISGGYTVVEIKNTEGLEIDASDIGRYEGEGGYWNNYGLYIENSSRIKVTGSTISSSVWDEWPTNVYLYNVVDAEISGNTVNADGYGGTGIYFWNYDRHLDNVTIAGNTVNDASYGIDVEAYAYEYYTDVTGLSITGNTVYGDQSGSSEGSAIYVWGDEVEATVTGNSIDGFVEEELRFARTSGYSAFWTGIEIDARTDINSSIAGNTVVNVDSAGIDQYTDEGSLTTTVTDNTVEANNDDYYEEAIEGGGYNYGISIYGGGGGKTTSTLTGNTVRNSAGGIYIGSNSDSQVMALTATGNLLENNGHSYGEAAFWATAYRGMDVSINDNDVEGNANGIALGYGGRGGAGASGFKAASDLDWSSVTGTISGNNLTDNDGFGMLLDGLQDGWVSGNYISGSQIGLAQTDYVYYSSLETEPTSVTNVITSNVFDNNYVGAQLLGYENIVVESNLVTAPPAGGEIGIMLVSESGPLGEPGEMSAADMVAKIRGYKDVSQLQKLAAEAGTMKALQGEYATASVANNTIDNYGDGILVFFDYRSQQISDNTIIGGPGGIIVGSLEEEPEEEMHGAGVVMVYTDESAISNNTITDVALGIGVADTYDTTVSENTITGAEGYAWIGIGGIEVYGLDVLSNKIHNFSCGVGVYDGIDVEVTDNEIVGSVTDGIALTNVYSGEYPVEEGGDAPQSIISYNRIFGVAGAEVAAQVYPPIEMANGIDIDASQVTVKNNTVVNDGGGIGILAWHGSQATVKNTIVSGFETGLAREDTETTSMTNTYNDLFANGADYSNVDAGTGEIYDDPLFIGTDPESAGFLKLQTVQGGYPSDSPAIDAGDPADEPAEGSGERIDIGAFDGVYEMDPIAPDTPTSLSVTRVNTDLELEWDESADNGVLAGYKVERAKSASGPWTQIGITDSTSYIDTIGGGDFGTTFYYRVRAYDAAGNNSGYSNVASGAITPATSVNDVTGDGTSDALAFYEYGDGMTRAWAFRTTGSDLNSLGLTFAPAVWWQSTSFDPSNAKFVSGDFDGDGRSDAMALVKTGTTSVNLQFFRAGAGMLNDPVTVATSSSWNWDNTKLVAGDFTGDGKDEVLAFYKYGGTSTGAIVFERQGNGSYLPRLIYKSDHWDWTKSSFTAGSFGGAKDGVVAEYNYGGTTVGFWSFNMSGSALSAKKFFDSNHWDATRSTVLAADYSGDGQDDVMVAYNYGGTTTGVFAFTAEGGTTFAYPKRVFLSTTWDYSGSTLIPGDFNDDGVEDIGIIYDYGNSLMGAWVLSSTGTALQAPVLIYSTPYWNNQNASWVKPY
ncbi:MAG: right-handed parallel beta-helix repeat-containing protein [Candidatus Aquicultorales bacterium]